MPRKRIDAQSFTGRADASMVQQLATELKSNRESGQPLVYEHEYGTGLLRILVIWDCWQGVPLEERSDVILSAYQLAESKEYCQRIALASGLTVPEAHAAGMLPYKVLAGLRKSDPVSEEQVRDAMLDEGASQLVDAEPPQLRFATREEAIDSTKRLVNKLPQSSEIWMVVHEAISPDMIGAVYGE